MGQLAAPTSLGGEIQVGWDDKKSDKAFTIEDGDLLLWCVRTYRFTPDEVVCIERVGPAWLGAGVRIVHNRPDCPARIRFACRGGSARVFELLARTGFVPRGSGPAGISRWTTGAKAVLLMIAICPIVVLLSRLLLRF